MTNWQSVTAALHNASNSASICALTAQESALAEHLDAHLDGRCLLGAARLEACECETPGLIELLRIARLIAVMSGAELRGPRHTARDKLIARIHETPQDLSES